MKTKEKTNGRLLSLKSLMSIVLMSIMIAGNVQAQVRIGEDAPPVKGTVLDLSSSPSGYVGGLKLPNVALTSLTDIPATFKESIATTGEKADLTGVIVYNTNTNAPANIFPGIYYWDGTKWVLEMTAGDWASSTAPTSGQVLKWNGSAWAPAAETNTTYSGSTSITLSGTSFQRAALTGDVTAAANDNATTVARIRGINVATTAPTNGQYLRYNGTNWTPTAVTTDAWGLNGNSIASTNFLGSTNNVPLQLKVNNTHAGIIGIGNSTSYGYNALATKTGDSGTAFGYYALSKNTGDGNSAFGRAVLQVNTTGVQNSGFGNAALISNTTGLANSGFGSGALQNNTSGGNNCAFGTWALIRNTTGNYNCAFGWNALAGNTTATTTGSGNVAVGYQAGSSLSTGSNNVMIGCNVQSPDMASNNTITIGVNGNTPADQIKLLAKKGILSDATAWTYGSDRRLKHDIVPIDQGLSFVMKLKPSEFVYNTDESSKKSLGFIAQEVQETMAAENMNGNDYHLVQEIGEGMLGLNTTELIPVLTKAIQEQQKIIEQLEARLKALEEK